MEKLLRELCLTRFWYGISCVARIKSENNRIWHSIVRIECRMYDCPNIGVTMVIKITTYERDIYTINI